MIKNKYEPLLLLVLALSVSLVLLSGNVYIIAIFLGLAISITLLLSEIISLWIILTNVYLISSLVSRNIPVIGRKVVWVTDLVLVFLLISILLKIAKQKLNILKSKENILLLLFFSLGLISVILNKTPLIVTFCGLRNYFKFVPLFFVFKYSLQSKEAMAKIFNFWLFIGFINVPISIYQYMHFRVYDEVGGLFALGGSGILTLFQILMICYLFVKIKQRILNPWHGLFLSLILIIPILINETKLGIIMLPLMLLYLYRDVYISSPRRAFVSLIAAVVFILLINVAYTSLIKNYSLKKMFSYNYLYSYLYKQPYFVKGKSLNRLSNIEFTFENISRDPIILLGGVGIGNASFSQLVGGTGEYYNRFYNLKIDFIFLGRILWEYGILGTGVFLILIITLWIGAIKKLRAYSFLSGSMKIYFCFYDLLIFSLLVTIIYNQSFHLDQFAFMFWMLSGYISGAEKKS